MSTPASGNRLGISSCMAMDADVEPSSHAKDIVKDESVTYEEGVEFPAEEEVLAEDPVDSNLEEHQWSLPDESELLLLCLDYLRDLRRDYSPEALLDVEGINADYLTLACWALTRCIESPSVLDITKQQELLESGDEKILAEGGNDAWFDSTKQVFNTKHATSPTAKTLNFWKQITSRPKLSINKVNSLPSIQEMEDEILIRTPNTLQQNNSDLIPVLYEYNDTHPSNVHRFFPLNGFASGPDLPGPLTLGELVAAGLVGLNSRTRRQAEIDLQEMELFHHYLAAVESKGFFDFNDNHNDAKQRQLIYSQRYAKVVAKFRVKLATSALLGDSSVAGTCIPHREYLDALTAAEQLRQAREIRRNHYFFHHRNNPQDEKAESDVNGGGSSHVGTEVSSVASYVKRISFSQKLFDTESNDESNANSVKRNAASHKVMGNPADLEEAERFKTLGNSHMQRKEYEEAAHCYTRALKLSPAGPQSHVYFSNRSAALVSLRQFTQAIMDGERALSLQPEYSKAHARLGLAHFLMGNYLQAKKSYENALIYEPNNTSNQSYLNKAIERLEAQRGQANYRQLNGEGTGRNNIQKVEDDVLLNEAEKFKNRGNSLMANRDYVEAYQAYTQALHCSQNGPQSHVYYSNRAAALCYLERYQEAEVDSLKSLALDPTYGKAHARLGLSRFFLQNYEGAVAAYTMSLKYDPDNEASLSYLAKAQAKLQQSKHLDNTSKQENPPTNNSLPKGSNAQRQHSHPVPPSPTSSKRSVSVNSARSSSSPAPTRGYVAVNAVQPPSPTSLKMSASINSARSTSSPVPTRGYVAANAAQTSPLRSPSPTTFIIDNDTRRLMNDESVRAIANKAMQVSDAGKSPHELLNDPEMHALSRKALSALRK